MTTAKVIEAAERYLSRQPVHEHDDNGEPLYMAGQMLRAFCAGEIAVIDEGEDKCPVCAEPLQPSDVCATDIEMGTCHAACLEGSPVVDLETGEPIEHDQLHTFQYCDDHIDPSETIWRSGFVDGEREAGENLRHSQEYARGLEKNLKLAVDHLEHMAAFIGSKKLGYSFESLGEDMPGLKAAITPAPHHQMATGKFSLGDRVCKTKGSSWQGRIVGFYSTELTPIGYAVESEREPGSVQIYPEAALVTVTDAPQLQHVLSITQHPNVESPNREQSGIEPPAQQLMVTGDLVQRLRAKKIHMSYGRDMVEQLLPASDLEIEAAEAIERLEGIIAEAAKGMLHQLEACETYRARAEAAETRAALATAAEARGND